MTQRIANRRALGIGIAAVSLVALILGITMAVYIVKYHRIAEDIKEETSLIYDGFSAADYESVLYYLMQQFDLHLVSAKMANLSSNYVFDIDSHPPSKGDVLGYLSRILPKPIKKARVTLFLGAETPKSVRELLVWPIPGPQHHDVLKYPNNRTASWQSRPICSYVEGPILSAFIQKELACLQPLLKEHYDRWVGPDCGDKCLMYGGTPRAVSGLAERTILMFFRFNQTDFEDFYVRMVSLTLLIYMPGNLDAPMIRAVYYDNIEYRSPTELLAAYRNGSIPSRQPASAQSHKGRFGSPHRRGPDPNPDGFPPPTQSQVQRRFFVTKNHVSWLGWEFDFRLQSLSTFQLLNLGFNKERIAYELGVQDIVVMYTGSEPSRTFMSFWDSGWQLGSRSSSLMRGYDCPLAAEYISWTTYNSGSDSTAFLQDIACVFEYTHSVPLRRHFSTDFSNTGGFKFRFSMPDSVLVMRQIVTVFNYDYIIDMELHQNGVIEMKIVSTGYILTAYSSDPSVQFGYTVLPEANLQARLHSHFFDVKVDLDIGGLQNRFKTVNIGHRTQMNNFNPLVNTSYYVMEEQLLTREHEAQIKYDFTKPKHLVIYNEMSRNSFNNLSRGYRIHSNGFAHPIYPDSDISRAASWMKHQVAVTRVKEDEPGTLSYFSQGDPFIAPVSLSDFQADNESIVDEDLVAWVTVGLHHIPTAEDLPVTTSAGKVLSVSLLPFNYFEEDPSIWSRDAQLLTDD